MAMLMCVRAHDGFVMRMSMMLVVDMLMLMFDRLVCVLVLVPLDQVEPHAGRHQSSGKHKRGGDILVQQWNSEESSHKRCS